MKKSIDQVVEEINKDLNITNAFQERLKKDMENQSNTMDSVETNEVTFSTPVTWRDHLYDMFTSKLTYWLAGFIDGVVVAYIVMKVLG